MAYLEKAADYASFGLQAFAGEIHEPEETIHMMLTYGPWEIVEKMCTDYDLDPCAVKAWLIFYEAKVAVQPPKPAWG